eukprot:s10_g55.t1
MDPAHVYGHRPQQENVWCLSPYEFAMYWECVPVTLPLTSKWGEEPERNAKLTLAYFKAWTLNKQCGNAAVPHVRQLRQADATWEQSLREWLLHLPCEETKRYVGNFLSVYRVRPENEGENSDDEDDKEDLVVTAGDLGQACDTHVPVTEGDIKKGKWSLHRSLSVDAIERAKTQWKTPPCELRAWPNPCQGLDSNSLLKSARCKPRLVNWQEDSGVREPEAILRLECDVCKNERRSKARVEAGSAEASAKVAGAKAIFATNAVKYHVNKLRAKAWAAETGQDCGSLYGVLPLCIGMPVAAADHLDRSRGILRGCPGEIVGWVWPAAAVGGARQEATQIWNELPACILVRFKTKTTWRVEGIDEDNVFPVAPQKKPWYLDKGRRRPVLRVTRKQFPLAPGFATTAHAAQGQTYKEGVVMDMHIGEAGDPLTAYIALTRVRDRHGLFVYRPFPATPFQKGAKVGRELLLRFWSGEDLDWSALRAKYRDERHCKECNESKPASAFTAGRWKRADAGRVCKECIRRHVEAQQPWQCMACTAWKQEDAFMAKHASPQATFYRICKTCEQTQLCSVCNTRKAESKFSAAAWKRARAGGRVCLDCSGKAWGWWRCSICKVQQAACAFESWLAQHRSCNGDQVCNNCWKYPIPRRSISKAVQRVAATQAKVATQVVQEKKARVVADVWAAIAERKRKRTQEVAEAQEAPPPARQRREEDGTERPTDRPAEMSCAQADDASATANVTRPAMEAKAGTKGKSFQYCCPVCQKADGVVKEKAYDYICPVCKENVARPLEGLENLERLERLERLEGLEGLTAGKRQA